MDALEFVKERSRMCRSHKRCGGCPLAENMCTLNSSRSDEEYKQIIAAVEQWSREHPRKTQQSIFLELYPETVLVGNDVITICPGALSKSHRSNSGGCKNPDNRCDDCRREFWMQEVE